MICSNCGKDVEGIWEPDYDGINFFACESCGHPLETENSYEDHIADMIEECGRRSYYE